VAQGSEQKKGMGFEKWVTETTAMRVNCKLTRIVTASRLLFQGNIFSNPFVSYSIITYLCSLKKL